MMLYDIVVPYIQRFKTFKSWLHHVCVPIVLFLTEFGNKSIYYPNTQYFDKHKYSRGRKRLETITLFCKVLYISTSIH
jgi:hypothetical protein